MKKGYILHCFAITLMAVLACASIAVAQDELTQGLDASVTLPGQGGYQEKIDAFFGKAMAGNTVEALNQLYSDNPWMSRNSDAIQNLINQMASLSNLVGQLKGYELLQKKDVAGRFVYLSYMAVYERQPMLFVFEYYKPENKWMIFSFSFDDKLDDYIEEQMLKDF